MIDLLGIFGRFPKSDSSEVRAPSVKVLPTIFWGRCTECDFWLDLNLARNLTWEIYRNEINDFFERRRFAP